MMLQTRFQFLLRYIQFDHISIRQQQQKKEARWIK